MAWSAVVPKYKKHFFLQKYKIFFRVGIFYFSSLGLKFHLKIYEKKLFSEKYNNFFQSNFWLLLLFQLGTGKCTR